MKHYCSYLEGNRFTLYTDHTALKAITTQKNVTGRLWQWNYTLSNFTYDVKARKGVDNVIDDCLSREPDTVTQRNDNVDDYEVIHDPTIFVLEIPKQYASLSIETLVREQSKDDECKQFIQYFKSDKVPAGVKDAKSFIAKTENLYIHPKTKLLMHVAKDCNHDRTITQVYLLQTLWHTVFEITHRHQMGYNQTLHDIRRFWF